VDEKSNEIPAVRDLLKAFASLASAVITIDTMHTQSDTTQVILGRENKLHWVATSPTRRTNHWSERETHPA
jgi:hypothetical protein